MDSKNGLKMEMDEQLRNCFFCGSQEYSNSLMRVSNQVWKKYKNMDDIDFLDTVLTALDIDGLREMKHKFSAEEFCLSCMDQLLSLCEVSLQVQQLMESLKQIRIRCKEILADSIAHNNDPSQNKTRSQIVRVLERGTNLARESAPNLPEPEDVQTSVKADYASPGLITDICSLSRNVQEDDDFQDNYEEMFTPEVHMEFENESLNNVQNSENRLIKPTSAPSPTIRSKPRPLRRRKKAELAEAKIKATCTVNESESDGGDNHAPATEEASDSEKAPVFRLRKKRTSNRTMKEVQKRVQSGNEEAAALGFEVKNCTVSVPKIIASSLITSLSEYQTHCPFPLCPKVFESSELLRNHLLKQHRYYGRMKCRICFKEFRKKSTYLDHQNKHHDVRPYKCNFCEKTFYDRNHLADHRRRVHTKGTPSITCQKCTRKFLDQESYDHHYQRFHSTDPISCEYCEEQFLFYKEYITHLRVHKDVQKKMYFCDVCDKVYTSAYYLKAHRRMHTGDRILECDKCDYKCVSKTHLRIHQASHITTADKLQCEKCSRTYKYAVTLKRHQQFDCGKEYSESLKCSFCDKCFKSRNNLLSHENYQHKVVGRPWLCNLCGKTFKIKKLLRSHTKQIHNRVQEVQELESIQSAVEPQKQKKSRPKKTQESQIQPIALSDVSETPTGNANAEVLTAAHEPLYQGL